MASTKPAFKILTGIEVADATTLRDNVRVVLREYLGLTATPEEPAFPTPPPPAAPETGIEAVVTFGTHLFWGGVKFAKDGADFVVKNFVKNPALKEARDRLAVDATITLKNDVGVDGTTEQTYLDAIEDLFSG